MVDQARLAQVLGRIAQTLITDYGVAEVLDDLARECLPLLEVRGAVIVLTDLGEQLRVAAASDDESALVHTSEIQEGTGPSQRAYAEAVPVLIPDLGLAEGAFAATARDAGVHAVAALPMIVHDRRIGALTLHRAAPGAFSPAAVDAAGTLAAAATAYVLNARALDGATRLADQLQHALESRVVIEQAKGKLSEQLHMDVGVAFELMRSYSRSNRIKLHVVAQQVMDDALVLRLTPPPSTPPAV